jgi:hypothetical protein
VVKTALLAWLLIFVVGFVLQSLALRANRHAQGTTKPA